jgi:hypothetical protein
MANPGLPQEAAVVGQHLRIALVSDLGKELGGALDVGEEEREISSREVLPNARRDHASVAACPSRP